MKILMVTNTFTPHVGGVARSVQRFTDEYRRLGHSVCVVAPGAVGKKYWDDINTIRIPAAKDVLGSSFYLPVLTKSMEANVRLVSAMFQPDVIHSHQPFLLGDLARKLSSILKKPLVYTQHTLYENFNHLLKNTGYTKQFLKDVSTNYANLCDSVCTPSESIREIMLERGVKVPVHILPNGTDTKKFAKGSATFWRNRLGIPKDHWVIGHVGRLSPEKNLPVLVDVIKLFLSKSPKTHFLLVGDGPSKASLEKSLAGLPRVHVVGSQSGQELIDSYHAMDVFAFPSLIDVGPLVLAEAMSAGAPVTAFDTQGSKDIVKNYKNGRLVEPDNHLEFCKALEWCIRNKKKLYAATQETANYFEKETCARKAIELYKEVAWRPKQNIVQAASFTNTLLKTFLR